MKKTLLLFSLLCCLLAGGAAVAQSIELTAPAGSGQFGSTITVLTNGNYVVTDPLWDNGAIADVGAVYLYNGQTHALISTLTGSKAFDKVGSGGVVALTKGNYVVSSIDWDNGTIINAGAITWGSGTAGVSGVVSRNNSLVGNTTFAGLGSFGITVLNNGNYVVLDPLWSNGSITNTGAITWCDGTKGMVGLQNGNNSLIGSRDYTFVGKSGVIALTNGNYVVSSQNWDDGSTATDVGAVTWCDGTTGRVGAVSSSNSLVGSTANDQVGSTGITALTNGNYVVNSTSWDNGTTATDVGAVTWCNGNTGRVDVVSSSNSLVGGRVNDKVGDAGIIALTNGNYVVISPTWDNGQINDVGAVTWGSGIAGIAGEVSSLNSLVGSSTGDRVGDKTTALTNGNYVVSSYVWDNGTTANVGAVTWCDGITGRVGAVSSSNSLVGSTANDLVGNGVTALTNGNYVVSSSGWDNGTTTNVGAVTWCDGTTGRIAEVNSSNSLVGSTANDQVGSGGMTALTNGNYVVSSPIWDNSTTATDVGAVTWCDGTMGRVGTVSSSISFVGTTSDDQVGSGGITALSNGNYVVRSDNWNNGTTATDVGAVTWVSGTGVVSGMISSSNSLIGSNASDQVGNAGITALTNGNYVVRSKNWDNGAVNSAGAYSFGMGTVGLSGLINACNSVRGIASNDGIYSTIANHSLYDYSIVSLYSGQNKVYIFKKGTEALATTATTQTLSIAGTSGTTHFVDNGCKLIASVTQAGASPIAGNTTAKVWIDGTQAIQFVKRHFEITPANNASTTTGKVTLYFTQAEFNAFNGQVPAPALLMPANPTDNTGIANLKIEKREGTSSDGTGNPSTYSGSPTIIDPTDTDIVWNSVQNRWEVSFDVTGFGGFWAKVPSPACTAPTAYNVTGGGSYCSGGAGVAIGLANSETGVTYQLKRGTTDVAAQNGTTGQTISFGNQTAAGIYTVVATRTTGGCTANMSNSVSVTVNDLPSITLGTIPAINAGVTSFTVPYTGSTGTPTSYSISGTGITAVTDGNLLSSPITVNLSSPASGSSIAFDLTVKNANNCTSANISRSVTVNAPCPSSNTLHVNASVSGGGTGDGSTWANAYASLSDALAKAHACSNVTLIKVAAGTYKPTKKPFNAGAEMTAAGSRDVTFHIPDGVTIEGGYNASTGTRDIAANVTILSGDIGTANDNTDNCYHVVLTTTPSSNTTSTIKIDGFSITGGNANGTYYIVVNGNTVDRRYGGGILTNYGTNTLTNNTIYSNSASNGNGGGIYTYSGTNTLTNNTIYSNSAYLGGGIFTENSTHTITNNTIYSNSVSVFGGGIYTYSGTNTLTNNIFWQNKTGTNASIASADYYAGGTNGNTFKNNLLQLASSNYTSTNNNALGTGASGNLFAQDPLFASTTAPINLALQATSQCINAGISGVGIPTTDITGATRTGNPDLGAYEYAAPVLPFITRWDLSKTGSGATQISFGVGTTGTVSYTWTQVGGTGTGEGTFTGSTATITGLPSGGTIDLSISPTNFNRFIMSNGSDKARLMEIKQWGTTAWASMANAFTDCSNMTLTATDVPNTAAVVDMTAMFYNCSSFNQSLPEGFNTTAVTSMNRMFFGCIAYNKSLPISFNTAAVTDMNNMFAYCRAFNHPLPANFNTLAVTDMRRMFIGASVFNQSLAGLQLNANVQLNNFLDESGLSVENYDATLTAFKNSGVTGRTMNAFRLKYCAAEADKAILTKPIADGGLNWTITDGGKFCATTTTLTLSTATNPTNCTGTPNGSIAFASSGYTAGSQTLSYKKDNVAATPATVTIAADGSFTLTGLGAGVYSDFAIGSTAATGNRELVLQTTLPQFTVRSNSPQCERSGLSLESTVTNAAFNTTFTYAWTGPNGFTAATANATISSLLPVNAGTYNLLVTNTQTGCSDTKSLTVVVFPLPAIPSITASSMQLCKGESVLLTGTCSATTDMFRWTTPPLLGNSVASLSNVHQRIIETPGVYKGLCESKDGCLSDEVSITISERTNCSPVFITISPSKAAICPGGSVQLTASGCGGGTLTWYGGASPQTGTSITATPTVSTVYNVLCSTGGSGSVIVVVAQPTVAVSNNIITGQDYIKATQTITSDKKIGDATFTPAPSVLYEAGSSITLLPGFVAEKWSTFKAEIKGCN